jgi:hypothetical protein
MEQIDNVSFSDSDLASHIPSLLFPSASPASLSLIALKEPGVIGLKEPLGSGDFGVSERATESSGVLLVFTNQGLFSSPCALCLRVR